MSDFDSWSWSDSPIQGEVTNENIFEQGLNSILGIARDAAEIKNLWDGGSIASGQEQQNMYSTLERPQNVNAANTGSGAVSLVWYKDPIKLAAAGAAAFLVYKLVK